VEASIARASSCSIPPDRRWRQEYPNNWEEKFRLRFEREMIEKYDTHFFVGTVHQHPKNWIVVGLFYPPRPVMADLFD
jgi:hypothetical protein